jgi:hypothetical protein
LRSGRAAQREHSQKDGDLLFHDAFPVGFKLPARRNGRGNAMQFREYPDTEKQERTQSTIAESAMVEQLNLLL